VVSQGLQDLALDAAKACVLAYGVRRTTLTDVARRAGVSRMSIYRRWPDVSSLVADLMSREWHDVVVAEPATIDGILAVTRRMRDHPLLRKIIEADPETLLPYMLDRRGTSQQEILTFLTEGLRAGQASGEVRAGDSGRMARAVLLTVQSFVLSAPIAVDETYSQSDLDDELRDLLRRYLTGDGPTKSS
jgi:AcrR family transcriptional regulator